MYNLQELLNDHQTGHSEFQDDNLITVRAGGTLYGQYKQSLRELYRRFRGLREIWWDREKLKIEIEEQEHKSGRLGNDFEKRYAEIEFKRKSMQMEEANRSLDNTYREFCRFYKQACVLKDLIGELTSEKRAQLDKEMWMFKVREMLVLDWVCNGRIGKSTYEFINCLPNDMKVDVFKNIRENGGQQHLISWYESLDKHSFTEEQLEVIDVPEVPKLEDIIWDPGVLSTTQALLEQ